MKDFRITPKPDAAVLAESCASRRNKEKKLYERISKDRALQRGRDVGRHGVVHDNPSRIRYHLVGLLLAVLSLFSIWVRRSRRWPTSNCGMLVSVIHDFFTHGTHALCKHPARVTAIIHLFVLNRSGY